MKIVAFASQKGGSGKTTLAGHLAVQAQLAGVDPVGVIDTDPQGTLADWHQARKAGTPRFAHASPQRLTKEVSAMREAGVKLLIIDTPPAIGSTIGRVIALADLVVIPARPSPHDIRAAGATVAIAEALEKPLIFVINGAVAKARIATEAAIALSQHGPLAPAVIHQRVGFAGSMIDGRTVMEVPGRSRSPDEVAALWAYVKKRLARNGARKPAPAKALKKVAPAKAPRRLAPAKAPKKPMSAKAPKKPRSAKAPKKPTSAKAPKKLTPAKALKKRASKKQPVEAPVKKAA